MGIARGPTRQKEKRVSNYWFCSLKNCLDRKLCRRTMVEENFLVQRIKKEVTLLNALNPGTLHSNERTLAADHKAGPGHSCKRFGKRDQNCRLYKRIEIYKCVVLWDFLSARILRRSSHLGAGLYKGNHLGR